MATFAEELFFDSCCNLYILKELFANYDFILRDHSTIGNGEISDSTFIIVIGGGLFNCHRRTCGRVNYLLKFNARFAHLSHYYTIERRDPMTLWWYCNKRALWTSLPLLRSIVHAAWMMSI